MSKITDYSVKKSVSTLDRGSYGDYGDGTPARQVLAKITGQDGPIEVSLASQEDNLEIDFADGNVSAVKAIYKTINGVKHADSATYEEATVIGISRTSATDGNKVKYKTGGRFEDSSLNFPINDPLYLGSDGQITNIAPVTGHRTRVGSSAGLGEIQILIEEPIIL